MVRWSHTMLGLYLEVRIIPVLLWSFTGITVGTALAWAGGTPRHVGDYLGAVLVGVLLQGVVAHSVNDLADWRSGTDRDPAPRTISGGSGSLTGGHLTERHLVIACLVAVAAAGAIGTFLAASRGWWLLAFGAVGLAGAVLYTLPPVRLAYRPFAGEAVAFACVWACGAGSFALQTGRLTAAATLAAIPHAAGCVAMLMVHHYLDRGPDSRARPPKVTSVVRLGDRARRYAQTWGLAAIVASASVAALVEPAFFLMAGAAIVALTAHARIDIADPGSVTRAELAVIGMGIVGGLGTAAALSPSLVWALPAAAALCALDLSVAARSSGAHRAGPAVTSQPENRS